MNLVGQHSRKELTATLCIWGVLLVCACVALLLLRENSVRIINHIHYVNVKRGEKAQVLYAEAEKNARSVLKLSETMNTDTPKKAIIPSSNDQLMKSIALYNEALKLDPFPEFDPERKIHYEMLAQVYDAAGNRTKQLLSHARAFMAQKDNKDALDYINMAKESEPSATEPQVLLAQLHERNGDIKGAMAALENLYSSGTVSAKARDVKGSLLLKTWKPRQAVTEFQQAVEQDPTNLNYRLSLGRTLSSLDQNSEAVKTMQNGLADGGWLDAAYLHLYGGFLIKTQDLDEAIRVLQQADKLAPSSGDVQWSLAKAYHLAGKSRQSASALKRAIEVKPELNKHLFK